MEKLIEENEISEQKIKFLRIFTLKDDEILRTKNY